MSLARNASIRASLDLICSASDSLSTRASSSVAFCSARAFLARPSLGRPVAGPQLVQPGLEGEELLDLVEVHPEHLAQLQDALEVRQVVGRVAAFASRRVQRRREQAQLPVITERASRDPGPGRSIADSNAALGALEGRRLLSLTR